MSLTQTERYTKIKKFEEMMVNMKMKDNAKQRRPSEFDSVYFPTSIDATISVKYRLVLHVVSGILSSDNTSQLESAKLFRELLSIDPETPSFEQFIEPGIICRLAEFLMNKDLPDLQLQAAFILNEIVPNVSEIYKSSGSGTNYYAEIFVKLLTHPNDSVREQAVWALGKVVKGVPSCHDLLRDLGVLHHVVGEVNEWAKSSMLSHASWTILVFCREVSPPPIEQIKPALQQLVRSDDVDVLRSICWALLHLTSGTNNNVQDVIDADICPRLVELLAHQSYSIYFPALRTVGNITTGDDRQTQAVFECGALAHLRRLLSSKYRESINKLACFAISNVTAGNKEQIESVIKAELISPLVTILQTAEYNIKEDAAWAIFNITSKGTHEQIKYLVSQGCIKPLCDLLIYPQPTIVLVCLEALENILKVGDSEDLVNTAEVNMYAQQIDDARGIEKIKDLKNHASYEISEKAGKILETFWLDGTQPRRLQRWC